MSDFNSTTDLPPFDAFNLGGIWVETLFYGADIVLYGLTLWVLLSRHLGGRRQCPLLATSTILFVLGTMHAWSTLSSVLQAFTSSSAHSSPTFSIEYWLNINDPKYQLRGYTAVLANVMQNLVLIWRLLVVSGDWRWAIVPYSLEVAHLVIGCYNTSQVNIGRPHHRLFVAQWSISLVVNILATTAIVSRLYYIANGPRRFSQTFTTEFERQRERWLKPIFTIVESGALYTTCNIVILALYVRNDPRVDPAVGVAVQVAVFCPLLILVRVGFGITHGLGSLKKKGTTNAGTYGLSDSCMNSTNPTCPISTGVSNMTFLSTTATTTDTMATSGRDIDLEGQYVMKQPILPVDLKKSIIIH